MDTQVDSETMLLSRILVAVWITFMGHFLQISFGQSFWFAWFTVHILCISGSSHGFYRKGLWVEHPLTSLPFDLQGAFLCVCGHRGLLSSRMRNMCSAQGPAFSLNCPASLVLEFQSTGNESPITLLRRDPSSSCLKTNERVISRIDKKILQISNKKETVTWQETWGKDINRKVTEE